MSSLKRRALKLEKVNIMETLDAVVGNCGNIPQLTILFSISQVDFDFFRLQPHKFENKFVGLA